MTPRRRTRTRAELKAMRRRAVDRRAAELAAMVQSGGVPPRRGVVNANRHAGGRSNVSDWQRLTGYASVTQRDAAEAERARAEAVARARAAGIHLP